MRNYDVAVIGAGAAGMAAVLSAHKNGAQTVALIERNTYLGGILNQCIHDGFGLLEFNESLTGRQYAARYIQSVKKSDTDIYTGAIVSAITPGRDIRYITRSGIQEINAKAIILATGCRERTRGMLAIAGTRPSGIYTAGVVQKLMNCMNILPGKRAVVLGSGDVGMIMAMHMKQAGMDVVCVLEKLPQLSGRPHNKQRCLDKYNIPLFFERTVVDIKGHGRLESVTAANVDDKGCVTAGTGYTIGCDTLVLSVGLIPENELARSCGILIDEITGGPVADERLETSIHGIFSAGNCLHVHPLVDYAAEEGAKAGQYAAQSLTGG